MATDQSSITDADVVAEDVERNSKHIGRPLNGVVIFLRRGHCIMCRIVWSTRGFGPGYRHCSSDALLQNPSSSKIQNIKIAKDPQITALELLHEIRSPSSVIISSSHSYAKYIPSHPDVPSDALRPKCVLSWSTLSPPRLATDHYGERSIEHCRRRSCCGDVERNSQNMGRPLNDSSSFCFRVPTCPFSADSYCSQQFLTRAVSSRRIPWRQPIASLQFHLNQT